MLILGKDGQTTTTVLDDKMKQHIKRYYDDIMVIGISLITDKMTEK